MTQRVAKQLSERIRMRSRPVWVVVAHRAGLMIFEGGIGRRGITLVDRIVHPEGRLKNSEIVSDMPGQIFSQSSVERHPLQRRITAKDHLADQFARVIADRVHVARTRNEFRRWVLVAEPRFAGRVRGALSKTAEERLSGLVAEDWGWMTLPKIKPRVLAIVRQVEAEEQRKAKVPA